jgi:hypothetical protein
MVRTPPGAGRASEDDPRGPDSQPRGTSREVQKPTDRRSITITRADWRRDGDLIAWVVREFPGLSNAQVEITDEAAEQVVVMLRGCAEVAAKAGAR